MKDKKNKCSKGVLIGTLLAMLLVIVGVCLAVYIYISSPKTVQEEKLDGGNIYLTYTDDVCGLTLTNLGLFSDDNGMALNIADLYFDFSVSVSLEDAQKISYEISLVPDKTSTVDDKYVKAYLEKQTSGTFTSVFEPDFITLENSKTALGSPKGSMVLHTEEKNKSTSDNYRLRLWVSDENQVQLTPQDIISYKVVVNGKAS